MKKISKKAVAVLGTTMLLQSVAAPVIASASEVPYYQVNSDSYGENVKLENGKEESNQKNKDDKWNSKEFKDYDLSAVKGENKVPLEAWNGVTPLIKQVEAGLYKNIEDVTFNDIRTFKGVYNKETKIVGLDLSNQELYKIPSIIKEMKELRYLDLSKNHIEKYPQWVLSFKLDMDTKLKISDLVSEGELKINDTKEKNEKEDSKEITSSETNNTTEEKVNDDKSKKVYETWNRVPQKPIITSSTSTENQNENFDKYISVDNEVVNVEKNKPKEGTTADETVSPALEEMPQNATPIEVNEDETITPIEETQPQTLPQTGALFGTNIIFAIGAVISAIGAFIFKKKKLN